MTKYITKAKDLYGKAMEEFLKARVNGDEDKIRQAAEKAWLAVVQATNALLEKRGIKVPKGTARREELLFDIQDKYPNINKFKLGEQYSHFLRSLHSDCFYDGDVRVKRVERDLRKVEGYIDTIENLLGIH